MQFVLVCFAGLSLAAVAEAPSVVPVRMGVARVSINPMEAGIPTQLGGYGAREARSAEATLDTIYGKVLLVEQAGTKSALITVDTCTVPISVAEDTLKKAGIEGLTIDRMLVSASHTHTGLEGFALDPRNIAQNKNIGIFSEPMLNFVTDQLAKALKEADTAFQPVKAGSSQIDLPGMNRNRRKSPFVDPQMTVLRIDKADGSPYAVLVNYTAHGTFVDDSEMMVSSEWAGSMQRTVEDMMGHGVICLYTNGAEGDLSPVGSAGGSNYERAWNYGRKVGIAAARLVEAIETADVSCCVVQSAWVSLPPRRPAPDFQKIAGQEYKVSQEELEQMVQVLFPEKAPVYALRVNEFQMMTFPGEPICEVGLAVKESLRKAGIANPCVASLTTDHIGYILTEEEYKKSGYEATASFYGDGLGHLMVEEVCKLGAAVAREK
jgi:hypothetical protein